MKKTPDTFIYVVEWQNITAATVKKYVHDTGSDLGKYGN